MTCIACCAFVWVAKQIVKDENNWICRRDLKTLSEEATLSTLCCNRKRQCVRKHDNERYYAPPPPPHPPPTEWMIHQEEYICESRQTPAAEPTCCNLKYCIYIYILIINTILLDDLNFVSTVWAWREAVNDFDQHFKTFFSTFRSKAIRQMLELFEVWFQQTRSTPLLLLWAVSREYAGSTTSRQRAVAKVSLRKVKQFCKRCFKLFK